MCYDKEIEKAISRKYQKIAFLHNNVWSYARQCFKALEIEFVSHGVCLANTVLLQYWTS